MTSEKLTAEERARVVRTWEEGDVSERDEAALRKLLQLYDELEANPDPDGQRWLAAEYNINDLKSALKDTTTARNTYREVSREYHREKVELRARIDKAIQIMDGDWPESTTFKALEILRGPVKT